MLELLRPFAHSLKFNRFQTLRNNMQQDEQADTTCNIQQFCFRLHVA